IVVKFITPVFGTSDAFTIQRYWPEFGATWGQFFWHVLTSPVLVLKRSFSSALPRFWLTFLFLPLFAGRGLGLVLASLPAGMMIISTNPDKSGLEFYNSALLFPGFWLASGAALFSMSSRARKATAALFCALLVVGAIEDSHEWSRRALP